MYARYFPNDQVGIVSWGQNDDRLLLEKRHLFKIPGKITNAKHIRPFRKAHTDNFMECYEPRLTWTRRLWQGNINRIIAACEEALLSFILQFGKPDVLHAHVGYPGGYIASKLSEKHDIPFMITEHMGPFPFSDFRSGNHLKKELKEPLLQSYKNLAVSHHLKGEMMKYDISSEVFHNYIDDDFFSFGNAEKSSNLKLLHIGRLAPEKRQEDLLKALSLLPSTLDFELVIAGEGELKDYLIKYAQQLGVADRVVFCGNLSREQIREHLWASDLLLLSSNYENFPVSIMEALACGKPVVATKCGGPEEMINAKNGLLANSMDPSDLADKIEQAVGNLTQFDPDTIRADFDSRFGYKVALPRLRNIYQQVIDDYHL